MKRISSPWLAAALAGLVATWLTAGPAGAQEPRGGERGGGGAGGGGAAGARGDSSGGGSASAGGSSAGGSGSTSSGGSTTISSTGGGFNAGGFRSGAHGGGATGGSGMRRETDSGSRFGSSDGDRGGNGSARTNSGAGFPPANGTASASGGQDDSGRATGRGDNSGRTRDGIDGVPWYARPRDGKTVIGTATPRGTGTTPGTPGVIVVVPGGYYGGGFYDPYSYDPYGYGGFGYGYGGYYDPWYGGYPSYGQSGATSTYKDEGALKLKIKPREAEVYVDGYYVGIVDDFDGLFQRLRIESGPHRVEVRAPGYAALAFDVRISPDHSTTYQGELKKIQ